MLGKGSCGAGLLSPCYGAVPSRGPQRFPAESKGGRKVEMKVQREQVVSAKKLNPVSSAMFLMQ